MSQPFRSLRPGRWALVLAAGLLLLAGLAAAPAPAGSRRAGNGHIDVVAPAGSAAAGPKAPAPELSVTADGETEPVGAAGDAADDMAFWVHPDDPAKSVVIGTDKEGALEVYDMAGKRLQAVDPTSRPGNVDLRPGFTLAGKTVDLIGVVGYGMRFYTIDPATRTLTNVTAPDVKPGMPVAGMCMYHSPVSGKHYLFADTLAGEAAQYELVDEGGKVNAHVVRGPWQIGSEAEGCVFDDEKKILYVAEEAAGIWAYGAEPGDSTTDRKLVDGVAPNGRLASDVEGLAIVYQPAGGGYLMASSQGDDSFVVYQRNEPWEYVKKYKVDAGDITDRCSRTDGIDAVAADLGPLFPKGVFSCQDHINDAPGSTGNQDFKLVRLEKILELV
ncbi:MAG: phytase [Actinomycetota bacterium]|nr:phytase [Actinomycetota bacterium]